MPTYMAHMLISPGPHVILMRTSPGALVTLAWQGCQLVAISPRFDPSGQLNQGKFLLNWWLTRTLILTLTGHRSPSP